MSSTKEKIDLTRKIQDIVKRKVTVSQIITLEFADYLRSYTFNTLDDKNAVLKDYCEIVLTRDRICAIFIDLVRPVSIKSFKLENKIRRGTKNQAVIDEFKFTDGLVIPDWYRTSKIKDNSN
jgi:hypothetical protein